MEFIVYHRGILQARAGCRLQRMAGMKQEKVLNLSI